MFSVIISEKGGAERRESFDRTEINVGRVQGNDLMLPKGNVSKRHARLLYRDGRFIVTDLKSTNGTYVNGRKIVQATIVREGDKIYIGDFVLRIESSTSQPGTPMAPAELGPGELPLMIEESVPIELAPPSGPPVVPSTSANLTPIAASGGSEPPHVPTYSPPPPPPPAVALSYDPAPTPARPLSPYDSRAQGKPLSASNRPPSGTSEAPSSSQEPSSSREKARKTPLPRIEPKPGDPNQVISHFPLEQDPDEAMQYPVPGPPRVPSSGRPLLKPVPTVPRPASASGEPPKAVPVPLSPPASAGSAAASAGPTYPSATSAKSSSYPSIERPGAPVAGSAPPGIAAFTPARLGAPGAPIAPPAPPLAASRPAMPPARPEPPESVEPSRVSAHRAAILALLERVNAAIDLRPLDSGATPDEALAARINRTIGELSVAMRAEGEIRPDVDADAVVIEARRELLEYGPLTPFFEDDDVTEIQVMRNDYVLAMVGQRRVPSDIGFSNEQSLGRVIRRLCVAGGRPLAQSELFVERRLPRGLRMFAVLPSVPHQGHMLVIRKPQRAELTLDDLVRSGAISRAMAGLLAQCVEARASILITGAVDAGAPAILGALTAARSTADRVVVMQKDDELIFNQPHTVSIPLGDTPEEGARAIQAAARVRPDLLVVGAFAGRIAAEVIDAMSEGVDGVLAAARAPTLRQVTARLTADLVAAKIGLTPEVAREWLSSAFDLVIEIARLRDGRQRVLRIAELGVDGTRIAIRDIFIFTVERTAAGGAVEGSFSPTGLIPGIVEDLAARGVSIDTSIFKRHTAARPGTPGSPAGGSEGAR
jgi:pilus assembly protein CpaF